MYDNEYSLLLDDDLFFLDDEGDDLIAEFLEEVHNGLPVLQSEPCPS